jgi:hypothetical protein
VAAIIKKAYIEQADDIASAQCVRVPQQNHIPLPPQNQTQRSTTLAASRYGLLLLGVTYAGSVWSLLMCALRPLVCAPG